MFNISLAYFSIFFPIFFIFFYCFYIQAVANSLPRVCIKYFLCISQHPSVSKEFGSKAKVHNRKGKEDSDPKIVYRLEGKCLVHIFGKKKLTIREYLSCCLRGCLL